MLARALALVNCPGWPYNWAKPPAGQGCMGHQKGNGLPQPDLPAEVVASAQEGDEAAFRQVVEHYQGSVFAIAWRMTHDRAQAEDLCQEVFLRLWRKFHAFDPGRPLRPWLLRLATNVCINALKRRRVPTASLSVGEEDESPWEPPAAGPGPRVLAEGRELATRLEEAIAELPEDYRLVVTLRHLEGLAYDQIAETLGWPLGTVKVRLFRARERLRRMLGPALGES